MSSQLNLCSLKLIKINKLLQYKYNLIDYMTIVKTTRLYRGYYVSSKYVNEKIQKYELINSMEIHLVDFGSITSQNS